MEPIASPFIAGEGIVVRRSALVELHRHVDFAARVTRVIGHLDQIEARELTAQLGEHVDAVLHGLTEILRYVPNSSEAPDAAVLGDLGCGNASAVHHRQLGPGRLRLDLDDALQRLRDKLGKADTFITCVEELIELSWDTDEGESGESDYSVVRRRNRVAHLIEAAKLAVRAAASAGEELDGDRREA
jgi:hypothetical protein